MGSISASPVLTCSGKAVTLPGTRSSLVADGEALLYSEASMLWEMGKRTPTGCEDFAAGAVENRRGSTAREGAAGEAGMSGRGLWRAPVQEEGSSSSPDLEILRARQQRLRELKAGLAAEEDQEEEEEEEELEDCQSPLAVLARGTCGAPLGEEDTEEEEKDEVVCWRVLLASCLAAGPLARTEATTDSPESRSGPSQASLGQAEADYSLTGELGLRLSPCWGARAVPALVEGGPLSAGSRIKLSASSAKSGKVMLRLQPEEQSRSRQSEPKAFRCNGFISEEGTQADVFEHVAPVVDRVMEGYNGVVFCYGITGSGKTHTMSGPPKEPLAKQVKDPAPPEVIAAQQGIVQRAAKRIFEFIRDRSALGEIFTVEASFLEIYSPDGVRENLIDLLANKADEAKLEVKQDALVGHKAFMCEGLKSVPIRSPDEMRQVLEGGRRRCTYMETSRNCVSSRPLKRRERVSTQMIHLLSNVHFPLRGTCSSVAT
ncbi:Klp61F [Symbiodinium sp. CCMP2456]|nr:Klp61F [Symbiodinium sp. CCMP2456]